MQLLPIDLFFSDAAKKPYFCSSPRKRRRRRRKSSPHTVGDRVRRVQSRLRKRGEPERGEREGREESPAVHLLCRGLLRSRIKSVSGALPFSSASSTSSSLLHRVLLRAPIYMYILLHTPRGIPDGPLHDNCPSTVPRLSPLVETIRPRVRVRLFLQIVSHYRSPERDF